MEIEPPISLATVESCEQLKKFLKTKTRAFSGRQNHISATSENPDGTRPERIRAPTQGTPGPRIRYALIEFRENDS
jgi:hypothetical protein